MSIYTQIKEAVSVPEAAERYGVPVNGNNRIPCPFHEDHDPSLGMDEDYYFCFGCHARGDVVNFVARLLNISQQAAVHKMSTDFQLIPGRVTISDDMPNLEDFEDDDDDFEIDLFEDVDLAVFRNDAALVQTALLGYEWLLEEWKEDYVPTFPDEEWNSRYTHACQMLPTVKYLLDTLTVGSFFERYELVQSLLEDDMIVQLRKFTSEELGKKYGKVIAQEAEGSEVSSS